MSDERPSLKPYSTPSANDSSFHALTRLWTPWRMRYVGGGAPNACVFCDKLAERNDSSALILHRGKRSFTVMNLFPYNTGHILLVPNAHVAGPEETDVATLAEMSTSVPLLLRALRRVLANDGFNIGVNVGSVAGAGIAAHLHQHIVPRWNGDANFMPILASTMVLPELIPTTYAKLRAELCALTQPHQEILTVVFDLGRTKVLIRKVGGGWALPQRLPSQDEPAWHTARNATGLPSENIDILGWAGSDEANDYSRNALFASLNGQPLTSDAFVATDEALNRLTDENHRVALRTAIARANPLPQSTP